MKHLIKSAALLLLLLLATPCAQAATGSECEAAQLRHYAVNSWALGVEAVARGCRQNPFSCGLLMNDDMWRKLTVYACGTNDAEKVQAMIERDERCGTNSTGAIFLALSSLDTLSLMLSKGIYRYCG